MTALRRAAVIAVIQVGLVLAVGGKLLYDRMALPRVWVQAAGFDPVLPIRGRYVALNLLFEAAPESAAIAASGDTAFGTLVVRGDRAFAVLLRTEQRARVHGLLAFERRDTPDGPRWMLVEPVAYFLPEGVPDPTREIRPGGMWMEVTVPLRSAPRPIRLR